ncbi:MAG: SDR family oxidoreductase [Chloroflexi bacterium]|nr:SDR family oxidoreductase [Chloroflexota bacterium]MCY3581876.1 SDR family oxidoreductase [Chloroflexota bacterium]MCY3716847.1 SDR family oxidoreductase [Chloroflexota bacterium]MDE2649667.1 SDR family oxidoreductase [Chloroflexota bacterium]MXV91942.1 SDR family oxidoreductase [Chloroflexota bacterium]
MMNHKTVVISGASHGLGLAIAQELAGLGAHVLMIARRVDPLEAAAKAIRDSGGAATALPCDVADVAQVQALAEQVAAQFGSVDALVNNAGIPAPRSFAETDFADWDAVISTNLSGVFYMTRALWDSLCRARQAYVINISGTAGLRGGGSPAYGAAKFGVTGLNHAIAQAGAAHGIRSTILYPGGMDTGWRGAPIGVLPREQSMDPRAVARLIAQLLASPAEFVVNEAVLNPLHQPFM